MVGVGDLAGYQPEPPEDILQQRFQAQQQQANPEAVYQQYQESQARFQEQQQQIATKQEDLTLGQRLVTLLDPNVPKPARQFLYKEMSRAMGVDPAGQTSKEVGTMLMGLDPEAMDNLRRTLAERIPGAKPGEITQMIKGVLTGKVGGMDLIGLASASPGGGEDDQTGGSGGPEAIGRRRLPTVGEVPPEYQRVEPQLQHALGFDPAQRARTDDLLKQGYALPRDPKEQQKLASEIQTGTANTTGLVTKASRLNALFTGKPEVLGPIGSAAQFIDSSLEQARGAFRTLFPDKEDTVNVDAAKRYAEYTLKKIEGAEKGTTIKRNAQDAALVSSAMVDLAYSMATARGIPGNRLTNAMINQHLDELGRSGSPDQFKAVLGATVQRSLEQNERMITSKVGKPIPADLRGVSDADLLGMYQSKDILPPAFKTRIEEVYQERKAGKTGGAASVERQSPTIEEEEVLQREDAAQRKRRENLKEKRETEMLAITKSKEERAGRTEGRSEAREERMARTQEEQLALAKRREDRLEEKDRRTRIQVAFAELAKIIASGGGSVSGGGLGGGDGGGGQNAEAFRVTPGQTKRAPPQPIDASRFQRRG